MKNVKNKTSLRNKLKQINREKFQWEKFTGNNNYTNPHKRELKELRKELKRNGEYSAQTFKEEYGEI